MTSHVPFDFHCIICFEVFDLEERPPVILPCGHTYICEVCSSRIKKCMECRTSLFVKLPPSSSSHDEDHNNNNNNNSRYASRYNNRQRYNRERLSPTPANKKKTQEQIPLPLPRNLILIELMQAAKRRAQANGSTNDNNNDNNNNNSQLSIPDDDEYVLDSIDALSSACGTYIVRETYGLSVYPNGKNKGNNGDYSPSSSSKPTAVLAYGQRVQIIDVKNGAYRLARNKGTIFANSLQIAKVGVAKEASCKIQGVLTSIQSSKERLSQQMKTLTQTEKKLRKELNSELARPANHPIIEESNSEDRFQNGSGSGSISDRFHIHNVEIFEQDFYNDNTDTEMSMEMNLTPLPYTTKSGSSTGTPTPTSSPILETPRSQQRLYIEPQTPPPSARSHSPSFTRSGLICGLPLFQRDDDWNVDQGTPTQIPFRRVESDEYTTRSGSEAINWKTGLSGHSGLNKARKQHAFARGAVRMMGEHRGIAHIKKLSQPGGSVSQND